MNRKLLKVICSFLVLLILSSCGTERTSLWNGKDFTGWKLFLPDDSVDVNDVWSVKDGVIHCAGVPRGYMRTEADYSNYILYLDWRWVSEGSNSGVLLHAQDPDKVWPLCIEAQLKSENAGDIVLLGKAAITVDNKEYVNNDVYMIIDKMKENNEKPIGEWNSYKIICKNNEITCFVNGVLQNKGTNASLSKGKICLQSEGAPIEFKNIYLESL